MITRQKCKRLQLCLGYRNVHDGMWKTLSVCRAMMPQIAKGQNKSFGFRAQDAGTE